MKIHRTIFLAATLLVTSGVSAQQAHLRVDDESRLWIQGTSTVSAWSCDAGSLAGDGALSETRTSPGMDTSPSARLVVPVEEFECGRRRMNDDFRDALKGETHPVIVYELQDARVMDEPPSEDGWYRLSVRGSLTIAGKSESIEAVAWGRRLEDGRYRVRGSKPLTMTAFGIQPPVALLGLVKAHDHIEVHFDLVATPDPLAVR